MMKHIVIVVIFLVVVVWSLYKRMNQEGFTDNEINNIFPGATNDNNKPNRILHLQGSISYMVTDDSIKTQIDGLSEQSTNEEVDAVIANTKVNLLNENNNATATGDATTSDATTSEAKNDTLSSLPSFGGWDIYLKQTYVENSKSGFSKNTSLNKNDMTQSNYYNNELTMNTFDGYHHFKLDYDTSVAKHTIYWTQDNIQDTEVILPEGTTNTFDGLIKGSGGLFTSPGANPHTIIGSHDDTQPIINNQPVVSLKLYVWTPRPASILLSENMDFETWNIPKVNMKGVTYYNKSTSTLVKPPDDTVDVYSYCFGKLKCTDGTTPIAPGGGGAYAPYCNEDEQNPVYCAGSALYSVKSTSGGVDMKDVNDKVVSFDLMGQYVNTTNSDEKEYTPDNYNKFRGLTVPSTDVSYVSLDGDHINYSKSGSQHKFHVCDMFGNVENGFDMKTTVKQACLDVFPIKHSDGVGGRSGKKTLGKKCIANKGDPLHDTSYIDYVCGDGETCTGYKCGVSFGVCEPNAECGGRTNYQTLED
jgi:hypothetical protein